MATRVPDKQPPWYVHRLIQELEKPEGLESLNPLRRRLGLSFKLKTEALGSKDKTFLIHSVGAPKEQGVVVKFNPPGSIDPYIDNAYKDYRMHTKLSGLPGTVPQPLFRSSAGEEGIVGTAFFVMTFIKGRIFRTVGEIPREKVVQMHILAVRKLAQVHRETLRDRELNAVHESTQSYWQETIDWCQSYYRSIVGWWRWYIWPDTESYIFSHMSKGRKPSTKERVSVVHGNLDIGNFVFNEELTEVRGILNWKYEKNGDPLIDLASLLRSFLDLGTYTLSGQSSLVYQATEAEVEEVVTAYRQNATQGFHRSELKFAEAVSCLKQINIIKRAEADQFRGHELRRFKEITDNPGMVIDLLRRHAETKYGAFSS